MGADLILAILPVPDEADCDWAAAEERIANLTEEQAGERAEECDSIEKLREQLTGDLAELRAYLEGGYRRDATTVILAGRPYLISGGMSGGDSPTEFSETMWRLDECGITAAAGFTEANG